MGDRYFLTVKCPKCKRVEDDVYYAPTSGIVKHECPCGHSIDLEELTGISYDEASNRKEIEEMCKDIRKKVENQ